MKQFINKILDSLDNREYLVLRNTLAYRNTEIISTHCLSSYVFKNSPVWNINLASGKTFSKKEAMLMVEMLNSKNSNLTIEYTISVKKNVL